MPQNGRFGSPGLIKCNTNSPGTFNEYIYCNNAPLGYVDVNGMFWHIVAGAVVGAIANTAITVGMAIVTGETITKDKIISAALGGATTGAVTAATGNPTLGTVAGGAVERGYNGWRNGDSVTEIAKDVAIGAGVDLLFCKVGKYIKSTPKAQEITKKFKSTSLGSRVFSGKANYDRQITRARNAFTLKNNFKTIKLSRKTYFNGFWEQQGHRLCQK